MPCFNASATLEEALKSLSRQTLQDIEINAIDDGSTDKTLAILKSWSRHEPRLQVFTQAHTGIVGSANAGLAICTAPYIARMDADDISHPERLEKQAKYLDKTPNVDILSCRVTGFPKRILRQGFMIYIEWLNSLLTDEEIRREIFVESPIPNPSVMFRKRIIEDYGAYQEHGWPEDYDMWLRLYQARVRFAKLPDILLDWRDHPARLTRTDARYSVENFLRAKAFYLAHGPLKDRSAIIIWGAGMMGRRLSKHLLRLNVPIFAFIDIDPRKIGRKRRGLPILPPDVLMKVWEKQTNPALLTAVGARGARGLIRQHLHDIGLLEGQDWWATA